MRKTEHTDTHSDARDVFFALVSGHADADCGLCIVRRFSTTNREIDAQVDALRLDDTRRLLDNTMKKMLKRKDSCDSKVTKLLTQKYPVRFN